MEKLSGFLGAGGERKKAFFVGAYGEGNLHTGKTAPRKFLVDDELRK